MPYGKREEEHSSRWLLRQFDHTSPSVKISMSKIYEGFYREEEAMIHRKKLALPYLISYLDDENDDVVISAARALGESESFRAVDSLIKKLDEKNESIRTVAVLALGKIRERDAVNPLTMRLTDDQETSKVKAQVLIALKRLTNANMSALFKIVLPSFSDTSVINDRIKTGIGAMHALIFSAEDRIVIDQQRVTDYVQQWFQQLSSVEVSQLPVLTFSQILQIMGHTKSPEIMPTIESFLHNEQEIIRATSYRILLEFGKNHVSKLLSMGLKDQSNLVKLAVITAATKQKLTLPLQELRTSLHISGLTTATLAYINKRHIIDIFDDITHLIKNTALSTELRNKVFETLLSLSHSHQSLPQHFANSTDPALRVFNIRFWAKQNRKTLMHGIRAPDILRKGWDDPSPRVKEAAIQALENRQELWALRTLKNFVLDKQIDQKNRELALTIYARQYPKNVDRLIHAVLNDLTDPLWPEAVLQLTNLEPNTDDKLNYLRQSRRLIG